MKNINELPNNPEINRALGNLIEEHSAEEVLRSFLSLCTTKRIIARRPPSGEQPNHELANDLEMIESALRYGLERYLT